MDPFFLYLKKNSTEKKNLLILKIKNRIVMLCMQLISDRTSIFTFVAIREARIVNLNANFMTLGHMQELINVRIATLAYPIV